VANIRPNNLAARQNSLFLVLTSCDAGPFQQALFLEPLRPSKWTKWTKISFHNGGLDFACSGTTMSDLMVDALMKLAYFAAIAMVHEAFASTL
jgi:hypothetical protein